MSERPRHETADPADQDPGVPGLRSWRLVYWLAAGTLALWIGLLTAFMWKYS